MKKVVLFTLVTIGLMTSQVFAQTYSVAHDSVQSYSSGAVDVHNTITNTSSGQVTISWKVVGSDLSSGWIVTGICDNQLCYPDNILTNNATQNANPINASEDLDLKVQFDGTNAMTSTSSWVSLKVWDKANPLSNTTITYIVNRVATGISTVTKIDDNILVYPNPASDYLNIRFDQNNGVKNIAVYNLIGRAVSVHKVTGNSAQLNVSNIPSGIYFVKLLDAQGRVIATRKFTHK